jgi:hypothetical protein
LSDVTQNLSLPRTRRAGKAVAAAFAVAVLGGSLTACGGDPGDTTCGEFKDMSVDERVDLLDEAAEDEGEDAQAYTDLSDDEKKAAAETLPDILCEGQDDDTKLDDIDNF